MNHRFNPTLVNMSDEAGGSMFRGTKSQGISDDQ
jgi:hypothetical protein